MKKLHLTLLAALLIGVVPLSASAAGWTPSDPLMPTGDSTLDTANLQAALHDSRLDSGGTLYLGPGTFEIHGFIGRQNYSDSSHPSYSTVLFNGTIQGTGKGVTILKGVRGPGGEGFEPLHYEIPGFASDDHTLLGFVQVYLGVKDLTFDSEATLVDPYNAYGVRGLVTYLGTGSFQYALNELIGTDITNVHFRGSLDSFGDPETPHLFQQWGDEGGVHNINSSEFENSRNGALQFFDLANATINIEQATLSNAVSPSIQIGGQMGGCADCTIRVLQNQMSDVAVGALLMNLTNSDLQVIENTVSGAGLVSVAVINSYDSNILVRYNRVEGPGGVFVNQWPWVTAGSEFDIVGNAISQSPAPVYGGIEIWDQSIAKSNFTISQNQLHNEAATFWGPIFTLGTQNATITGNRITGSGPAAMYLGSASIWGADDIYMYVADNDVLGFTPKMHKDLAGDVIPSHYWLGSLTNSITVIGQDAASDRVFDTGLNNTVSNAMHIQQGKPDDHPGQSMFDETAARKSNSFPF